MSWLDKLRARVRFDRNELAGSFGDLGTDLPLILAMIPAAGLHGPSVFALFGAMQILTGVVYGLPMPVQPLKAMAMLVIAQKIAGATLAGAGVAIGVVMLALSLAGALEWLARVIPHCVVRGIQLGLGLSLATLALKNYVPAMGGLGYAMAGASFLLGVFLLGNRRFPPALPIVLLGVAYAAVFELDLSKAAAWIGFNPPHFSLPAWDDIVTGFFLLALPQIPLSLSNSVIATSKTLHDLFPEKAIGVRKIGFTYAAMNLTAPLFGGIPVCHGCGGLAGHHAFGARTGGSVVIYGAALLTLGLLMGHFAGDLVKAFPLPILGVILIFESLALMSLVRDVAGEREDFTIALLVAVIAAAMPHGFVIGTILGTLLAWSGRIIKPRSRA